jgi:hypothetical protein
VQRWIRRVGRCIVPAVIALRWTSHGDTKPRANGNLQQCVGSLGRKNRRRRTDHWSGVPVCDGPFGAWRTMPASRTETYTGAGSFSNWFCGFWVGMLLAAFLRSGRRRFLEAAEARLRLTVPHSDDRNTHDIGFNLCTSLPSAYFITGDPWFREVGLHGAKQLRSRLVTTRSNAYIPSWPPTHEQGGSTAQIDTIPVLSLLHWAALESKDDGFNTVGEAHAKTTREHFVRRTIRLFIPWSSTAAPAIPCGNLLSADMQTAHAGRAVRPGRSTALSRRRMRPEASNISNLPSTWLAISWVDLMKLLFPSGTLMIHQIQIRRATPLRRLSLHRHCWICHRYIPTPRLEPHGEGTR